MGQRRDLLTLAPGQIPAIRVRDTRRIHPTSLTQRPPAPRHGHARGLGRSLDDETLTNPRPEPAIELQRTPRTTHQTTTPRIEVLHHYLEPASLHTARTSRTIRRAGQQVANSTGPVDMSDSTAPAAAWGQGEPYVLAVGLAGGDREPVRERAALPRRGAGGQVDPGLEVRARPARRSRSASRRRSGRSGCWAITSPSSGLTLPAFATSRSPVCWSESSADPMVRSSQAKVEVHCTAETGSSAASASAVTPASEVSASAWPGRPGPPRRGRPRCPTSARGGRRAAPRRSAASG